MKIIIIQQDRESAQSLSYIFLAHGDSVDTITDYAKIPHMLEENKYDIAAIDSRLPENTLFPLLKDIKVKHPEIRVMITSKYPELTRELEIKQYGVDVFLRAPFNKLSLEKAMERLETLKTEEKAKKATLPKVRRPVRLKIIFPFLILALLLSIGAGYLISKVSLESIENRFVNNLIETGYLTTSWIVEEENRRLETLRSLAFTEGMVEAIVARDAVVIREIVLGEAINRGEEAIEILDTQGTALVSIHHKQGGGREEYDYSSGDTTFSHLDIVRRVLSQQTDEQGDKYGGLVQAAWGDHFYVIGPVLNEEDQIIGAVMIGRSLDTIVKETRNSLLGEEDTFAHIAIYDTTGQQLAATFSETDQAIDTNLAYAILSRQDQESYIHQKSIFGIDYREIVGTWEVRGGYDLGLIGASIAENFLVSPSKTTQIQIFILATLAFFTIIVIGFLIARSITNPLLRVVEGASQVSEGEWDTKIEEVGNDELTYLASTFNYMISHLKEGEIYRDLLGRSITPQVRDQLRKGLSSGDLKLEGQNIIATIIITDIRDFTMISENQPPTTILKWLNQYYGTLVPVVEVYKGVTHEFTGDSMMAFFGVLPKPQPPSVSAYQACRAAVEMVRVVEIMNTQRCEINEPPLVTGIGVNTGSVAAGGMGTADRLHYAIIGDTVNTSARLEGISKEIGKTCVIIGEDTYNALGEKREEFRFIPMGTRLVKGKSEPVNVYRLLPSEEEKKTRANTNHLLNEK